MKTNLSLKIQINRQIKCHCLQDINWRNSSNPLNFIFLLNHFRNMLQLYLPLFHFIIHYLDFLHYYRFILILLVLDYSHLIIPLNRFNLSAYYHYHHYLYVFLLPLHCHCLYKFIIITLNFYHFCRFLYYCKMLMLIATMANCIFYIFI